MDKHGDIERLLTELRQRQAEPVPGGLGQAIKGQIPARLLDRAPGRDPVSIIVHFRISRLAAVAAIVLTLVLSAHIFRDRDPAGGGLVDDIKMVFRNWLPGRDDPAHSLAGIAGIMESMADKYEEVVYYGGPGKGDDGDAILVHCRRKDGTYTVFLCDGRCVNLSPEQLVRMQARQLNRDQRK